MLKEIEKISAPLFIVCSEIRLADMSFDGESLSVSCDEITYNILKSDAGILSGVLNSIISPVGLIINRKSAKVDKEEELIKLKELLGEILEIMPTSNKT